MKNWSVDTKKFKTEEARIVWQLEQQVNWGPEPGEKIDKRLLRKYFHRLHLDPKKRDTLKKLLNC